MTGKSEADRLRDLSGDELQTLVAELEERAELFSAQTRMLINDELRRRRLDRPRRYWR